MKKKIILLILFILSSCSHLFYQPSRYLYADPEKFVLKVEDVWFYSKDGTKLNGWWMPSTIGKTKGSIVFFHGNAQNISAHFFNLAWITHLGYNLFIFDYRGYGQSEGSPNQKAVNEDALAALDIGLQLHSKNSPGGKFIVYGQSLGGVISLRAIADFKEKKKIDLVVQDSTFMSYKKIAFDKLSSHWLTFLLSPLAYVLVSDAYASDDVIKKIDNPLLVIIGEKDQHVNPKFGKTIYEDSPSKRKWLWQIDDGVHIDVFSNHGNEYRLKFLDLLSKL